MTEWVDVRDALPPVNVPVLVFNGYVSVAVLDVGGTWMLMADGEFVDYVLLMEGAEETVVDVSHWAKISPPSKLAPKEQNGEQL